MWELFTESIRTVNLPYTILLGLVCLYWVLYLVGAMGTDALDFLGVDLDVDVDVDADVDIDAGSHGPGHALASILQFLHVGELPVVLIASILITFMWAFSVLSNYYLGTYAPWFALLMFVPILVTGAIATKAVVMPFAPYLKKAFDQSSDRIEVVGKRVTIISMEATSEYGQAEFITTGSPLLLNVKTREGVTMAKGEEAIVYEYDKASSTCLVAKFDVNAVPEPEE